MSIPSKSKLFSVVVIIIVNCFFFKGISEAANESILRNGNSFIKIKELHARYKALYTTFNHPCSLSEKQIMEIFSNIFFQEKGVLGHGNTGRVFSDSDLAYVLSPLLVEGLARLEPTQYLLVYNSLTRSYLKNKHNYFCLFVVDQNLYIVFGRIHHDLTKPYNDEENIVNSGIEFENPMDMKKGSLWKLVPASGQSVQPDRENILIIPLSMHDSKSLVTEADQKVVSKKPSQKKQDNKEGNSGFAVENNIPDSVAANDGIKQTGATSHSLKEHLRLLKSLLEEGLISNENYEKKKNELLDKYFEISIREKD
ncbi:MAG: SHOCT domain-containing protein [Candidatus Brocadiales bacterium]|nr:SHOCT domain-containing protein [Candidatus Brocadiales bacterium]